MRYRNLCVYRKVSKTYKVFVLAKDRSYDQNNSMARKYMNRFAIEEDDQFEIHVKDSVSNKIFIKTRDEIYNAVEEVMLEAQQGSGYSWFKFIQ